jgi:hypothetical protein
MASAKDMNTALEQLYEQSQTAIEQKNSKDADFYLARYMGLLVTEKTDKKFSDLYPLFEQYETLKVDAAINGNFDNDFINWYIFAGHSMWGASTTIRTSDGAMEVNNSSNGKVFVGVFGFPYLQKATIVGAGNTKEETIVLALIKKPFLVFGKVEKENPVLNSIKEIPLDMNSPVQYVFKPEFYDIDKDGSEEVFIRYNKTWTTGFSQVLDIYKIENDTLVKWERFEGLSEGIAKRQGDTILIGEGSSDRAKGHMEQNKTLFCTFEYKNNKWIQSNQSTVEHILCNKKWSKYYS